MSALPHPTEMSMNATQTTETTYWRSLGQLEN